MTRRRAYPRWLVRGLALFAAAMLVLAAIASREHHSTESQRNQALSRLVALEARDLASSNRSLAMQLALVSYGMSHTVEARSALLDIAAGELPTRLLGRPGRSALSLGDDGHRVAIAYRSGERVQIYSLRYAQLTPLATVPAARGGALVDTVALSRSGRDLAVGDSDGRVTLWSLSDPLHPRQVGVLRAGAGAVRGLSFSPGGAALAAADADGSVQRWSLARSGPPAAAPLLRAPGGAPLEAVSYSHDGRTLGAVGRRGTLVVWRAHAGSKPLAARRDGTATLTALSYAPGDRLLAVGARDGATQIWSLAPGGVPRGPSATLPGRGRISSLGFSRDGRYLAAGTGNRIVRIWATSDWHQLATLPQPGALTTVAFTDGDRHLLSSDVSGTTLVWQFPPPGSYRFDSAVKELSFSTTEPRLVVSTQAGRTDQWDVVDEWRPAPVGSWYAAPLSQSPPLAYWTKTATTTTPTTTRTTSGTDTTISTPTGVTVLVNPRAGDLALRRTEAFTRVVGSALSPDGQLFAAAATDHLVWLWDVSDPSAPKLIAKLSGFTRWATNVVFSKNDQTLFAAGADHAVRMWDLTTPGLPRQLTNSPLVGPSSAITQLTLSPDGRTLAVATVAGHVWMWGVGTPSRAGLTTVLTAAPGPVTALAFSPSGNTLVAASGDRRLTSWHYRPYQAVNRICALEGTPITAGEWAQYVPGASYKPPCARWKPPVVKTVTTASP